MSARPALGVLAARLGAGGEYALDTEGDGLHHYPDRLTLVQLADPSGDTWLVDPLALDDLAPLAPLFARPDVCLVAHAAENDLGQFKRRYGYAFGRIFDTATAARLLGARALGLDTLVRERLGVELPPSRQKDDWSVRPLTPAQEAYAAGDVSYLLALKAELVAALTAAGRLAWVEEECAALAAELVVRRAADPDAWGHLKGARALGLESRAILRELHGLREALALAADRPPFKILSDEILVRVAAAMPDEEAALGAVPGCTPRVLARWGGPVLAAVARARALPEGDWPAVVDPPRGPGLPGRVRRRIECLRERRAAIAERLGLDPGVALPNRVIRAVAEDGPRDLEALARVEGVRRWRVEAMGADLLGAMEGR